MYKLIHYLLFLWHWNQKFKPTLGSKRRTWHPILLRSGQCTNKWLVQMAFLVVQWTETPSISRFLPFQILNPHSVLLTISFTIAILICYVKIAISLINNTATSKVSCIKWGYMNYTINVIQFSLKINWDLNKFLIPEIIIKFLFIFNP